jgi:ribosomal protein S18 acetylase RimI-like enzyme
LASNRREVSETRSGLRVRRMEVSDVERVLELRSVVSWATDPRAFDLLRGVRDARWFVAEAPDGGLAGMVGAVPLGAVGILCHLAVHHGYRGLGLGRELSAWAVAYLKGRGTGTVRLYATGPAEPIYRSLGFRETGRRTAYRLDGPARVAAPGGADVPGIDTLRFGDLPELYGVDLWGNGADRSPLIFSALGLRSGRGLVARDAAGRMEGYLILDASDAPVRIGPFAARTPEAARRLLLRALWAAGDNPVRVISTGTEDCPSHDLLRELGFVGRPDRLRMELGRRADAPGGLDQYGTTPFMAT